jgi:hypothetical protein
MVLKRRSSALDLLQFNRLSTRGALMKIPIRFPSEAEVITEEVTRFRALSAEDRLRAIRGLLAAGALMMRVSPKAQFLREYHLEQENQARQTVGDFVKRHARGIRHPGR